MPKKPDGPTVTERVVELVRQHPGIGTEDLRSLAGSVGMTSRTFTNGLRSASAHKKLESTGSGPSIRWFLPGAVTAAPRDTGPCMVGGRGERLDDCGNYSACLRLAAREHPHGACCPKACPGYRPRDPQERLIQLATARPLAGQALAGAA